jgi:hypothetical protein
MPELALLGLDFHTDEVVFVSVLSVRASAASKYDFGYVSLTNTSAMSVLS